MAAPTAVVSPANGAGSGTTLAITKPAGLVNGDGVLIPFRSQGTVTTEVTPPSGFVRAGSAQGAADRGEGFLLHVVTDAASEPASYTLGGWSAGRSVGLPIVVKGLDPVNPIAGGPGYSTGDLAAYVAAGVPLLVLAAWGDERLDTRSHQPSAGPAGYTLLAASQNTLDSSTTGSRTALAVYALSIPDGGSPSIDAAALTWPVGVSANRSVGVALRGVASTPTPSTKPFTNVDHFLATPGATAAWRLGGGPFPQHSKYAALQSAALGYKALEFSCGFTSDIVPFGLGPQYLDTMAGVTGNVDPTTMDWATLSSTYQIQNNPVGPGIYQPFYRLVDFLQDFSSTHICLVDPKFGFDTIAKIDAMLNICDANGGPSRILIKFDSPTGATNLSTRARARGYKVINYWGTDTASMATQQANWDCLGVAYDAAPSVFTTAKSYGKKVWGAIVPNQAGYDAAKANGADFMNVSGVTSVAAVGASGSADISKLTFPDAERAYLLKVSGLSPKVSQSELRRAVYGVNEHAYFAARSGLPIGSLADHQLAYYRAQLATTKGGLSDLARAFFARELA